jgi:hypothetical protein
MVHTRALGEVSSCEQLSFAIEMDGVTTSKLTPALLKEFSQRVERVVQANERAFQDRWGCDSDPEESGGSEIAES